MPQTGTCGPSVGQTVKESAMAESPRVALQRQAATAAVGRAHQVLVNGSQILPLWRCLQKKSPRCCIRRPWKCTESWLLKSIFPTAPKPARKALPSVHHRRLKNADHRGVRRFLTQVADSMRHIATVAQRLAGAGGRRRLADFNLELAVQNRQALD